MLTEKTIASLEGGVRYWLGAIEKASTSSDLVSQCRLTCEFVLSDHYKTIVGEDGWKQTIEIVIRGFEHVHALYSNPSLRVEAAREIGREIGRRAAEEAKEARSLSSGKLSYASALGVKPGTGDWEIMEAAAREAFDEGMKS